MTSMLDILREQDGSQQSAPNPAASNSMLGILQELDDLPAAAADPAGVPPSPAEAAPPVDPVVPGASGGRNNARVAPEPPVAADEPFDIDAQIARNNEFAARVDDVLANTPSPSGRNDTSRFDPPVQLGQDGVNPVSVFNPAPVDPTQAVQDRLVAEANAQPGPTQLKADLGLYTPDRSFGTAFEYGGLRSRGSVLGYAADLELSLIHI